MFWILRRTGAVNFFNSLNNNCSFTKGNNNQHNNNNGTQDKYVKRPPRKAYGRLSGDADGADGVSLQHKIDDPFDDLDNFDMITPGKAHGNGNGNGNGNGMNANMNTNGNENGNGNGASSALLLSDCTHPLNGNGNGGGNGTNGVDRVGNGAVNGVGVELQCTAADCQGNFMQNDDDLCELDLCIGHGSATTTTGLFKSKSGKTVNEQTINRLHALALAGDDDDNDDYEESLTCNVCDRAFHCHRQLASHQQKKRHFGCSGCDSLFPSLMLLEHHKEEFEHWSDDELGPHSCCRRNRCDDDYFTDTDSFISDAESEDLERLL